MEQNRHTEQSRSHKATDVLEHDWVYFPQQLRLPPAKFLATANELGQRKTELMCYKDILLTVNWYKIS